MNFYCCWTLAGAGVAVVTDTIFVCGGYDGANHLVSVESYNVCTGHWSIVSNMNIPRCYVGACVLKGKLYVVAGFVCLLLIIIIMYLVIVQFFAV